jgi:hypothetical protein
MIDRASMKPNLFIVGAPKCGTSAWRHYLDAHPEVYFAPLKEPTFFASDFPDIRPIRDLSDYIGLFEGAGDARILAEASTRYLLSASAAKNIREFNPDAKILIFLREQESYLPSLHNNLLLNGDETVTDFDEAWRLSEHRDSSNVAPHCREPWLLNYKATGHFGEQVQRFYEQFPADQIRVFHFRDWSRDPRATYLEIMRFLNLPDDGRVDFPRRNEAKNPRSRLLAQMIAKKPFPLNVAAKLVKLLLGQKAGWRVSKQIFRLNARKGYAGEVNDRIRDEIRSYYAAHNRDLDARITRPPVSADPRW